jgi:hypothetical protein
VWKEVCGNARPNHHLAKSSGANWANAVTYSYLQWWCVERSTTKYVPTALLNCPGCQGVCTTGPLQRRQYALPIQSQRQWHGSSGKHTPYFVPDLLVKQWKGWYVVPTWYPLPPNQHTLSDPPSLPMCMSKVIIIRSHRYGVL